MRSLAVAVLIALAASPALAEQERPRLERVLTHVDPTSIGNVVNSKTIFLNRCSMGCKVLSGFTDSRMNTSQIGHGTLSAFEHGTTTWNGVVTCVKDVFKRFNVQVTDVDPGPNVDHFEIMVAGTPSQLGLSGGIGGIAEYACTSPGVCSKYIPNALVFAFANVYAADPDEICSTVAQEIAHTWSLDHVTDPSDPMTYFSYSYRRQFKDGVMCGSDCVNGVSPFGLTCSGSSHTCMSSGGSTQNDVQILTALFGPAGAVSPTLTIKNPVTGSAVGPGFVVEAECTGSKPIQEVQLSIDGLLKATLTAPPFSFTTSTSLTEGPHKVTVLCATTEQAISTKTVDVILGKPCTGDSMCPGGYICFESACIAGPGATGGLGATCTKNEDCVAGACASDGEVSACTIQCDLSNKNCPEGFGCLEAGTIGVCWAGFDDGSGGCCDTGGNPAGSLLLALSVSALLITRRRSKNRR
jgi:hypothetical protein